MTEVIRLERGQDPPYGEDYVLVDLSGNRGSPADAVQVSVKGAKFFVPLAAGETTLEAVLQQARALAEREEIAVIYLAGGG